MVNFSKKVFVCLLISFFTIFVASFALSKQNNSKYVMSFLSCKKYKLGSSCCDCVDKCKIDGNE